MGFSWKQLNIPRLFGLDLKTNVLDVKDGFSLDSENVYQSASGSVRKRSGNSIMFDYDEGSSVAVDEVGSCILSGTKYYFRFANGKFKYATTLTGSLTTISPSPAISTSNQIWWAVLDDKLFFVDGTNNLRFFNGTNISDSAVYQRPTVAPTYVSGAGTGYDFVYTVDKKLGTNSYSGESPASPVLTNKGSTNIIRVPMNTGPQTLVEGDIIRLYSRATSVAAASKNVTSASYYYEVTAANVSTGYVDLVSVAISDDAPQLYSELGVALNKTAVSGLTGITVHFGRLVGWKEHKIYNSKVTNAHSWPDDTAQREAFVYTLGLGDGSYIQRCYSFRENLVIFKKAKLAVLPGIGPDDTGNNSYAFRRLETHGLGCIAPKSVCTVGDQKESYLVYLSKQGWMATVGDDPIRIGERVETEIMGTAESNLSNAVSMYNQKEGFYMCWIGSSTARKCYILDVRKDDNVMVGWFKLTGVNIKSVYWDDDRYIFGTFNGYCGSERTSGASTDFSDVLLEYVSTSSVNTSTNEITVANSYQTGDSVIFRTTGTVPSGLTANTTYYVIRVSATKIKLATSLGNAQAGSSITLSSQGSGTHSIVSAQAINAYYTTNWIKFKSPGLVKKLGRPTLTFNAITSSVNLTIYFAYDWVSSFSDSISLTIASTDSWGDDPYGSFLWGAGVVASPRNLSIPRRKVRSIRFKFVNSTKDQDFSLQGIEIPYDYLRNRGNFSS